MEVALFRDIMYRDLLPDYRMYESAANEIKIPKGTRFLRKHILPLVYI